MLIDRAPRGALRLVVALGVSAASLLRCAGGGPQSGAGGETATESLATALQHGDAAFKDGEYDEAALAYQAALRAEPDHQQATASLGLCYLKTRQVLKAQELLTGHLSRHPENTAARLVLARALLRLADYHAAATELQKVLTTDPDNLLAHYNLGFIAYRSRDYEAALEHLKRTLALRPDHPEAHYTLGLTYLALERYPDAVDELQKAIAIDPRHVGAHYNLANAAARAGLMDLAAREQKTYADLSGRSKAETERSEQVKSSSLKAVEFLMAQKYPEALAEYQRLVAAYPDYAPLHNDIGRVQLKLGRRDDALASLRKAVELDPKLSEPHYLLSNIYHDMGDEQAAARERSVFAALETIPEGKSAY